jgi:hypothetical protein
MESEIYLLAKVFFRANSILRVRCILIRSNTAIKAHHSCEGLTDFNMQLSSLFYSRKPIKSEKLKGRELLED